MARNDPEFRLRLPESLKNKIEELAKKNQRSINAEIVARLEQSFALSHFDPERTAKDIEDLLKRVARLENGGRIRSKKD